MAPKTQRPSTRDFQIEPTSTPSPHMPPRPVMTIRGKTISAFGRDQAACRLDDIADILQLVPGLDRVHFDLDAISLFEIEHDLGQFERMDAEIGKFGVDCYFIAVRLGVRFYLLD